MPSILIKVYISSTFLDLKEFRMAAVLAIQTLGHHAVGMEFDSASDERPLDQCLAAVRSCDVYIGLFAFRYGYIVPGFDRSITQLEYEEATQRGIDRLIFMVDAETPWPRAKMDRDTRRIEEFRTHLNAVHRTDKFQNCDDLAFRIGGALSKLVAAVNPHQTAVADPMSVPRRAAPAHLAYLVNRLEQAARLNATITTSVSRASRPIVCLLDGEEENGHDAFLERLTSHSLPRWLGLNPSHEFVLRRHLAIPKVFGTASDFDSAVHFGLAAELMSAATPEAMVKRIEDHPGPVIVSTDFYPSYWADRGPAKVEGLLKFWQSWPDLSPGKRLLVFICIKYNDRGRPRRFPWFGGRSAAKELAGHVEGLRFSDYPRIHAIRLERLAGMNYEDVRNWCKLSEVLAFCNGNWLENEVKSLFARADFQAYTHGVPMDTLVRELNRILSLSPSPASVS